MPSNDRTQPGFLTPQLMSTAAPLVVAAAVVFLGDLSAAVAALVALVGGAASLAMMATRTTATGLPAAALARTLEQLSAGDAGQATETLRSHGLLTPDVEATLRRLGSRATTASASPARTKLIESVGVHITGVNETMTQQLEDLDQVRQSLGSSVASQRSMSEGVDELSRSAEESASSILEMVTINNEVRSSFHSLSTSVEETTTAIEEMTFSSKEVAKNIEDLSTASEETAASMNQMDVSISQVETNATETSKLSELVTRDAETGVSAISQTIRGIDRIKESSRVASEVITNLGAKINQIGNILNVIDDVAEQTNLLALNAAIIAAQAGDHGRGFAVVADEIKALAERTGASTKEIASLITAIQEESRNAVQVMGRGVDDVQEGVRLGHNAEEALRKIVDSAKRSTLMIQAIAQATVEQSKGSKQVTNAIARIAETVQQIAHATAEQARGAEHIMASAERMKIITQQVERSADEQSRGGQQVTQAVENIRHLADSIDQALQAYRRATEQVGSLAEKSKQTGDRAVSSGRQLERSFGELCAEIGSAGRPHASAA